jgi:hypothetical protein
MAAYDDIAARFSLRFRLYATAVAGERGLAAAAGLKPESVKRWSRAQQFRDAFAEDAARELGYFLNDHLASASELFQVRGMQRLNGTLAELSNITGQIQHRSNRDASGARAQLTDHIKGGAAGLLAQRRLATPTFKVEDAAGRVWDAEKLVYTIVRDYAYQTHIDSQFDAALNDGAKEVAVAHPNPNHSMNGVSIDLTGPAEAWLPVRDETFHINSRLQVRHVSVPA